MEQQKQKEKGKWGNIFYIYIIPVAIKMISFFIPASGNQALTNTLLNALFLVGMAIATIVCAIWIIRNGGLKGQFNTIKNTSLSVFAIIFVIVALGFGGTQIVGVYKDSVQGTQTITAESCTVRINRSVKGIVRSYYATFTLSNDKRKTFKISSELYYELGKGHPYDMKIEYWENSGSLKAVTYAVK